MARTIILVTKPGIPTPTLDLVDSSDTVEETITLTEDTNAKGQYTGPLTADPKVYTGVIKSVGSPIGVLESIAVKGSDPENLVIRDKYNVHVETFGLGDAGVSVS